MPEFVFTMHNVRKKLGEKLVLDNVTLSFFEGAKIGVVGPNGAGKTTASTASPAYTSRQTARCFLRITSWSPRIRRGRCRRNIRA